MKAVKKSLAIILLILVSLLSLTNCAGIDFLPKPAEVRICIDLAVNGNSVLPRVAVQKTLFQLNGFEDVLNFSGSFNDELDIPGYELEFIPYDKNDPQVRLEAIQKMRDEIAAGKGPDILICACFDSPDNVVEGGRLFPDVKQAMEEDIFLPLDDYFEVLELGDHCQPLLDGGKDSQGRQVVIPVTFSVPVTLTADGESMDFLPDMRNICNNYMSASYQDFVSRHPDYNMEPQLNEDGEVVAQVAMYCAVNKNSACLEKVLGDKEAPEEGGNPGKLKSFIRKETQQCGSMFCLGSPEEGQMLSAVESMSPLAPNEYYDFWPYGDLDWQFATQEQYQKWADVCSRITKVEFPADN